MARTLPAARVSGLLLAGLLLACVGAQGSVYPIDSARSQAVFGVRVLWLHTISGRFAQIVGMLRPRPDQTATVDASIDVQSVQMSSARTRRWMLSAEFFDAAHYPQIHFDSDPVPLSALAQGGRIDGRLAMRGQVRPVQFELLPSRCSLERPGQCVIELHGSISRADFGMSGYRGALSDHVELALEIALEPAREAAAPEY